MNLNPFRRREPTPSEAARILSEMACMSQRERIRARCRLMAADMGRDVPDVLKPITERK